MARDFAKFVSLISKKNPLQKKALESFLKDRDDLFWQRAEYFAGNMLSLCKKEGIAIEYIADSYLKMCKDMLTEQVRFQRTGKYLYEKAAEAHKNVNLSEQYMSSYMYGLAFSQFLWPNHYSMFNFFIDESSKLKGVNNYLEVGPGHGVYLVESLKLFPRANFTVIDISPISIRITEKIVEQFQPGSQLNFIVKDINDFSGEKYDYIVMCEVLEHLDSPQHVLLKLHDLLSPNGRLFITTCANCPAIDHVYLYENVSCIRREIRESGFDVVSDLPLAVGDFPKEVWDRSKVEINYAAMLKRA